MAASPADKTVYLHTYGCQMNAYDSAKLLEQLRGEGYRAVDDPREAGLILLNTCAIREKAQMKVYSELGALRELKAERPGLVIGVTGCVAQQEGARLLERNRHVELVVGTDALFALPAALAAVRPGRPVVLTERPRHTPRVENFVPAFAGLPAEPLAPSPVKAQIAITKGCNNFCTFCVVPNTRGREVSREPENILAEARALVARGAREITLLGQNVNSYAAGGTDFVGLLERLDGVAGLARVRYTSPHPKDFHARLAQAHGALATLCEHLHLPVQSGSDRILAAMRRRHTAAEYLEKVALFRAHCPAGAVSTDIIVGFPGESEADFEATLALVRQVRFDHLYAFKFSPRTDTPAARYPDQVAEPVKAERLARLLALHELTQAGLNRALVGTRQEVLVEGPHPRDPSAVVGRTRGNKSTTVVGCRAIHSAQPAALAGTLVTVEIVAARRFSLVGRDVDHESQGLHGNEGVPAGAGPQHELAHRGPAG